MKILFLKSHKQEMENDLISLEAEQHITLSEKANLANEVRLKQAFIDAQSDEMMKLRLAFAEKAKEIGNNVDRLDNLVVKLEPKVNLVL